MDERFMEQAEAITEMHAKAARFKSSKGAIPSELLLPPQYKRLDCEGCGDDLTEFRLQRGRLRCVDCQNAVEGRRGK